MLPPHRLHIISDVLAKHAMGAAQAAAQQAGRRVLAAGGMAMFAQSFQPAVTVVSHDRLRLPRRRARARALRGEQQQAVGRRGERGVVGLLRHARAVGQEALAEQRVADVRSLALLAACARAARSPPLSWQGRRTLQRNRRSHSLWLCTACTNGMYSLQRRPVCPSWDRVNTRTCVVERAATREPPSTGMKSC